MPTSSEETQEQKASAAGGEHGAGVGGRGRPLGAPRPLVLHQVSGLELPDSPSSPFQPFLGTRILRPCRELTGAGRLCAPRPHLGRP